MGQEAGTEQGARKGTGQHGNLVCIGIGILVHGWRATIVKARVIVLSALFLFPSQVDMIAVSKDRRLPSLIPLELLAKTSSTCSLIRLTQV